MEPIFTHDEVMKFKDVHSVAVWLVNHPGVWLLNKRIGGAARYDPTRQSMNEIFRVGTFSISSGQNIIKDLCPLNMWLHVFDKELPDEEFTPWSEPV